VQSGILEKEITKTEALLVFIETTVLLRYPMKAPIFLYTLIGNLNLSGLILSPPEYFLIFDGYCN
jgi:hypothetical protein